jgi:DNA-binding NarL/FixJ family response regulator
MGGNGGPSADEGGLGRRERDVLAVSARGLSVCEVAAELELSEQEIRTALAAAVSKLGARSKLEALIIALRCSDIAP